MLSDNKKIIVWFLVCLGLAFYAKLSGNLPPAPGDVLGKTTASISAVGFGPLLKTK